jgi:predicted MFS family arabinose efflux permease
LSSDPGKTAGARPGALRLHRWNDQAVFGVAVAAFASGFGQFGAVAALGDVARGFGQVNNGTTVLAQVGMSGTALGIGLAIMRLASLGALPIIGLADRLGRRRLLLATVGAGLAMTVLAAASPGYWWFVAIFACGRPVLAATNGLAQVAAAELTASADRAKAVALIAAGYGAGAGVIAIAHSLAASTLGFRGVFVLALAPLALLPLLQRWITEPDRFTVAAGGPKQRIPVFDAMARPFRRRLAVIVVLAFAVSVITGPANSFVFLFAQNVLHQPGIVTAGMVTGAGAAGAAGLLAGRWLADRAGRRLTGALAMTAVALLAVVTYSGSSVALLAGYILGVFAASVFAPAFGSLVNELFPTTVRASAAGWSLAAGVLGAVAGLVVFGAAVGAGGGFVAAGLVTFIPAALIMTLFWLLPETRGREPEDLWPGIRPAVPQAAGRVRARSLREPGVPSNPGRTVPGGQIHPPARELFEDLPRSPTETPNQGTNRKARREQPLQSLLPAWGPRRVRSAVSAIPAGQRRLGA